MSKKLMEGFRWGIRFPVVAVMLMCVAMLVPEMAARLYTVGEKGWNTNTNYKSWARGKNFYNGDWLYFVYDRNKYDVLEMKYRTNFEDCFSKYPLHNWTTGAGRDAVPLNMTKTYYFLSRNGCRKGMKVAIRVKNRPLGLNVGP